MTELVSAPRHATYDLNHRFNPGAGPALLTGVQAIARLIIEQHLADQKKGLRTGSFISGYQGSPLGGLDRLLAGMPEVLAEHDVQLVPGFNEEIAATSVWGSQAVLPGSQPTHDGVIGYWYGKGPGFDRAVDVLRHANTYGVNPRGGILLLVGDDPASKSSTLPAASERTLASLNIPVLFPRNALEIVTLGLHGIALSRASGCAVALKIVADVADGAWLVPADIGDTDIKDPSVDWDNRPFTYVQRPMAVASDLIIPAERDLLGPRQDLVLDYAARNPVNSVDLQAASAQLGIVAAGTTFDSVRQALADLALDDTTLASHGIKLLRLGMISPLSPTGIKDFATGLTELLVVEDKTAFIETQIREILYEEPERPTILGKRDQNKKLLVPADGELTAGRLLNPMRHVLQRWVPIQAPRPSRIDLPLLNVARAPYFCSGCPHNRSTAVPEGSLAGGGIGCHIMVTTSGRQDSAVTGLTQMGGEGAQWIGQAAFTDVPHIFQNVGDGTYFHSAQLAVQACVAAGVNITYKILYNDVVAMTGAQDPQGAVAVEKLTHKLASEGVERIIVVADEPERHNRRRLAKGTDLWQRDRLDEAQRALRDTSGVTVLIYDQHCAADARRQRKRGKMAPRNTRVVINEAVCEGCGDCGVKSNCLSVQPVQTELGRKTRIDQTSCNTDYSCLEGDCPAFMTVEAPSSRPRRTTPKAPKAPAVKSPTINGTYDVFMAGIGGTGIVTVNQVLATAAMLGGREVQLLDQTGLSQKAGPVAGHLRFSDGTIEPANRLSPGAADCILAFDLLTATTNKNLAYGDPTRTVIVTSTSETPTGDMVYNKGVSQPPLSDLLERADTAAAKVVTLDALYASTELFGDTTTANLMVVGAAFQAGALPLDAGDIEEALRLNGVAVEQNIAAFNWGRASVSNPEGLPRKQTPHASDEGPSLKVLPTGLNDLPDELKNFVERRSMDLTRYQGKRLTREYLNLVSSAWSNEPAPAQDQRFTSAVALHLFRFMAYKDEYEVARLLVASSAQAASEQVPGGTDLTFKLHPPVLRALGMRKKVSFGPRTHVTLRGLARGKVLRGTPLDPFGHAKVRRVERQLATHFASLVSQQSLALSPPTYERAVELMNLAEQVRGYEDIKLTNVRTYLRRLAEFGIDVPAGLHDV